MPALLDIRRRIRSVKNTQQITKAMKMVSASKLRRAQEAMFAARPYARRMVEVLGSMVSRASDELHPLLESRDGGRIALIVITADKGLCGGFNANIIRAATQFLRERPKKTVELALFGRKGRDYLQAAGVPGTERGHGTATPALCHRPEDRPGRHGGVHLPRGGRGPPGVQRVQDRHPAAHRRRASSFP